MKKLRSSCIKIIIALVIATMILSLFTMFYRHGSRHVENPTGATIYSGQSNALVTNLDEGFAYIKLDENGFNNASVKDKVDVLIMGSSIMEAYQMPQKDNTASVLSELLPDESVYNIGVSGHLLYHCVYNLKNAVNTYHPEKYIVIEVNSVELDTELMQEVLEGTFSDDDVDRGIKYQIKKYVPVSIVMWIQMARWMDAKSSESEETQVDYNSADYQNVLDLFLEKAEKSLEVNEKIIIAYNPKGYVDISEDGEYIETTNQEALAALKNACDNHGIIFTDVSDDFKKLYEEEHVMPYGFYNTGVGRGHMNKYGHKVFAQRIAQTIQADQQKEEAEDTQE